jgi:peptide/nickel transport system permease protein
VAASFTSSLGSDVERQSLYFIIDLLLLIAVFAAYLQVQEIVGGWGAAGFLTTVVGILLVRSSRAVPGLDLYPAGALAVAGWIVLSLPPFGARMHGARLALFIGVCTVVVTAFVGGLLGLVAGFVERWPSAVLMRIADVQLSFPFILLALTINAIVGLGLRNIILSLSAAGWVVYARVVRGEVLTVKQRDFVHAAAALGVGRARLLFRHVLPNVAPSLVVVASLQFSQFVVAEAAISFLGFGVQPPTPAWGSMLSESRDFLYVAWWLAAFPGLALALTALGVNLLGDWLRDTFDPKLRV